MLKPQDILVLLKVHISPSNWTYNELAQSLNMSSSEVHAALKRCHTCHLYHRSQQRIIKPALEEFLIHGLKYVFPSQPGALVRGLPTAHSAPPLNSLLSVNPQDIYVWSFPNGDVKGQEIQPLYRSVPHAVQQDPNLYELLSLVDSLRVGKIREQQLAAIELNKRLYASSSNR